MARERVNSAPKVFEDTRIQACDLISIIQTVKDSPELHIEVIHTRVDRINRTSIELQEILQAMAQRQRNSPIRQGLHALTRGEKDDGKLSDVLRRLDRAKNDLMLQISVINVDLVGKLRDSFTQKAVEMNSTFYVEGNECWDNANQTNGIHLVGTETISASTTAKVMDNRALGNSQQRNLILSGSDLWKNFDIQPSTGAGQDYKWVLN